MSAEYARKLEKEDRQERLDRQPVGPVRINCRNTAPGNLFAYNVMMTSGAVNR